MPEPITVMLVDDHMLVRRGFRLLLSEDLQDGFTWRGVTVANPFAAQQHPLWASLLRDDGNDASHE